MLNDCHARLCLEYAPLTDLMPGVHAVPIERHLVKRAWHLSSSGERHTAGAIAPSSVWVQVWVQVWVEKHNMPLLLSPSLD